MIETLYYILIDGIHASKPYNYQVEVEDNKELEGHIDLIKKKHKWEHRVAFSTRTPPKK